jgi:biotin carboxyl carrier protein
MNREIVLTCAEKKESRRVELKRDSSRWQVWLDGNPLEADVTEIGPHTFSIILHNKSYELRVTASPGGGLKIESPTAEFLAEVIDPREWRGRHGGMQAEGRQQVVAPMPGKVIRILIKTGEKVAAGHALMVVEAMKMQNEIRSPKAGTAEKIAVVEGQAVNAGDVLCIVS